MILLPIEITDMFLAYQVIAVILKITYAYNYFEIMVVIRPAARSC